jgi:hypothetical protein
MFTPAVISLLAGMALGQRFKVLVLVPLILLTAVFAIATWVAHGGGAWQIGRTAAVAIVGLQMGYLLGLGVRHLTLLARVSRLRSASLPGSYRAQRPAH